MGKKYRHKKKSNCRGHPTTLIPTYNFCENLNFRGKVRNNSNCRFPNCLLPN